MFLITVIHERKKNVHCHSPYFLESPRSLVFLLVSVFSLSSPDNLDHYFPLSYRKTRYAAFAFKAPTVHPDSQAS